MSLLLAAEIYAAFCALTGFLVFALVATAFVWDWLRDMDAQRRMDTLIVTEAARFAEDAEVARLDALYALPARRHP